jgi:hypothetical protein
MIKESDASKKDAKFLKDLHKQTYLESGQSLDERINRNRHYIERDAKGEE